MKRTEKIIISSENEKEIMKEKKLQSGQVKVKRPIKIEIMEGRKKKTKKRKRREQL